MNRRGFLTLLATLVAWVSRRPKVHADAVKADPRPTIAPDRVIVRLWDGLTLVEERVEDECHLRDVIVEATMPAPDSTYWGLGRTVFRRSMTAVDIVHPDRPKMYAHYVYESGPKWWDVERRYGGMCAELANGSTITCARDAIRWAR